MKFCVFSIMQCNKHMYYLSDICSLCLANNKNITFDISRYSREREILECIIPKYISQESDIPMQICDECVNSLYSIFKFRQRCLENIITFYEHVQKLKENNREKKHLVVMLIDIAHQRKYEIFNDNQRKDDNDAEEANYKIGIETDIPDLVDEELIIKEDSCYFEDDVQEYCAEVGSEFSIVNEERNELTAGNYVISADGDQNGSQPSPVVNNEIDINDRTNQRVNCEKRSSFNDKKLDDACRKTSSHKGHVNKHKRIEAGTKKYTCNECQRSFSTQGVLTEHGLTHSDIRLYECDKCEKTFKRRSDLNRHKRIVHSNKKPYKCDVCHKTFKRDSDLNIHERRVHSNMKPYKCDVCEKTFALPGVLDRHKIIHSVIKKWKNHLDDESAFLTAHECLLLQRFRKLPSLTITEFE